MNKTNKKEDKIDIIGIDKLYDEIMNNWENIKLDKDTETLIDKCKYHPELLKLSDEKLKKLELIYNEILIRQQKYIEAFDNLGCFYYIEQHYLQSDQEIANKFIHECERVKDDI